jgi:hypothetical protein
MSMAALGLNCAHTVPRFLLPKLSWQTTAFSNSHVSKRTEEPLRRCLSGKDGRNVFIPRASALISRRAFRATPRRPRDHHFDTLKFVQRLQEEGFTEAQSVAMMKVLSDVIEERFVLHAI